MIQVKNLIKVLERNKINFFTGVPDSILKGISNYLEKYPHKKHVIATNEGAAISMGIGNYLSTKKIPCIYLQNSYFFYLIIYQLFHTFYSFCSFIST